MSAKPNALVSKISKDHTGSSFQDHRLENKLLHELG